MNRLITWLIHPGADITLDFMRFESRSILSASTNDESQVACKSTISIPDLIRHLGEPRLLFGLNICLKFFDSISLLIHTGNQVKNILEHIFNTVRIFRG